MIEVLDAEHCRINGAMVDVPAIQHWIEMGSFSSHNPIQSFYRLRSLLKRLADGEEVSDAERKIVRTLEKFNNAGYYVPDEAFSTTPGLYRYESGGVVISWSVDTVVSDIYGAPVKPLWSVPEHA